MAFFKFRKGGDDKTAAAAPPESVEVMRKRARHRLIGAAVLVLVGVIGFPLLMDNQPRPIAVDIPIEIPDRNKVKPLTIAPPAQGSAQGVPAPQASAEPKAAAPSPEARQDKPAVPAPVAKSPAKPDVQPEPQAKDKPAEKPPADSGAKAQALLDGKAPPDKAPPKVAAANDDRFVVQVGAFAEVTKAREARMKVERAGLKTYTQVVETKDGRRIRVRVGPFDTRAEADKAAEKIKKLDLPAAILTL